MRKMMVFFAAAAVFTAGGACFCAHLFEAKSKGWLPEEEGAPSARWVEFKVDGGRAYFYEGADVRRGINVGLFNFETGRLESSDFFDTWARPSEASRLASFLSSIPNGKVVLIAVKDDGATNLTEEVFREIERLGAEAVRLVRFRESWAFIARKGHPEFAVKEELGIGLKTASTAEPVRPKIKIMAPTSGTYAAGKQQQG